MSDIDVRDHFPGVEPEHKSPALFRINGFGVGLYGRRDTEPQTGLYVKTQCLSALFIPVFALRSYVVAPAPGGGWYVLGRVPVSGLAKLLNLVVLLVAVGVGAAVGLGVYATMPGPAAAREMAQADELRDAGDTVGALDGYAKLAHGKSDLADDADAAFVQLVLDTVASGDAAQTAAVLQEAAKYTRNRRFTNPPLDAVALAMDWAASDSEAPPRERLWVLDAVEAQVGETRREAWFGARLGALEQLVEQGDASLDTLIELALVYEARNDLARVRALLAPRKAELGTTEGARLLGQALSADGDADGAFELLDPYVASRLLQLHRSEDALDALYEQVYTQAIRRLENGQAPQSWYDRYDRLGEAEQDAMVQDYIDEQLDSDANYTAELANYLTLTNVVPAALDLGIARLDRARAMDDPDARRRELEAAEQTFLGVQGAAGGSASYQLYLGQVYYWLGKPEEGQGLFDRLLEERAGNAALILEVAGVLRQVGEEEQARGLFEQAYAAESDPQMQYRIARAVAALAEDVDEQILWLERGDPGNNETQGSLAHSRALRAMDEGDNAAAATYLDEAIALYDTLPDETSILNNSALVWQTRYALTGEVADLSQAVDRLGRAVELDPSNRVLLGNAAEMMFGLVYERVLADRMDLRVLEVESNSGLLNYLYADAQAERAFRDELEADPMFARAMAMQQRVVLLAPKSVSAYYNLGALYNNTGDFESLGRLLDQARVAQPDIDAAHAMYDEALAESATDDADRLADALAEVSRLEVLIADGGLDVQTGVVARVMLATELITIIELADPGETIDTDRPVRVAQEAHAASPSSTTHALYREALILRAEHALLADHPVLGDLRARLADTHSSYARFVLALEKDPGLRAAASDHPDIQHAVQLSIDLGQKFPDRVSMLDWALARQVAPQQAQGLAELLRADRCGAPLRELYYLLSPYFGPSVYSYARGLEIAGDSEGARQAIRDYAALGYPMP